MKLYRFSPITSEAGLVEAINYLHVACHTLCLQTFGRYLPVCGNVGVFAHYEEEYAFLTELRGRLTDAGANYKDKYFMLHQPIVIAAQNGIPGATYELLYIRQVDPYRSQVGDIDFVLPQEQHEALKGKLHADTFVNGARLFGRPEENIIELWNPDIDATAYVATSYMRDRLTTKGQ